MNVSIVLKKKERNMPKRKKGLHFIQVSFLEVNITLIKYMIAMSFFDFVTNLDAFEKNAFDIPLSSRVEQK